MEGRQTRFADARVKPAVRLTRKMNVFHYKEQPSAEGKQAGKTRLSQI